jgi:hypothetical protein
MGCYQEGNFERNMKMCFPEEHNAKSRSKVMEQELRSKTEKGFRFNPSTGMLELGDKIPRKEHTESKVVVPRKSPSTGMPELGDKIPRKEHTESKVVVPRKSRGTHGHF